MAMVFWIFSSVRTVILVSGISRATSIGTVLAKGSLRKTGNAFTRLDAAKVEAANDALANTHVIFTGIAKIATIELAPYIEAAATAFNNWATAGEGVGANVSKAFEITTLSIIRTGEEIESLIIKLNRLASPVETVKKNFEAMRIAKERYLAETGEGRRLRPGQPELYQKMYMEERARLGIEPEPSRLSATQEWFENLRTEANKRAAEATEAGKKNYAESGRTEEQLQNDMNNRVKIHEQGMQQIIARESEAATIMKGFWRDTRYDLIHFWDPIIDDSMTASEAVNAFFHNFFIKLAQAKAQAAMANIISSAFGGGGGFGGGYSPNYSTSYSNAGVPPSPAVIGHRGWIPGNMPSFHGGRSMRPDEMVALVKRDELIAPASQIIKNGGSAGPTFNQYITIKAMDSQDVRRALQKEKSFLADLNYGMMKSNHPNRRFER